MQIQYVRIKPHLPGFLVGDRFITPSDGPFPTDVIKARELVRLGLVDACAEIEPASPKVERAVNPPKAERATLKR